VLAAKGARRIIVGDGTLTFLFENHDTVRYQVQEMMRTERLVKEADIAHELHTYNELLGGDGELGCTLLIGIGTEQERNEKLTAWVGMSENLYVVAGGERIRATFDPRQVGDTRLSAVQYLKFAVGGLTPTAIGCDHPALTVEQALSPAEQEALAADLATP